MTQHIVISAIGNNRPGLLRDLTEAVRDAGGNIVENRMSIMGSECAMLMLVEGNWHTLGRLEQRLQRSDDDLAIAVRRTEPRPVHSDKLPYAVDLVCLDQAGILHGLSVFFGERNIEINEMSSRSYSASHTEAPMFSVQMVVSIPNSVHLAALREEFMEFCDRQNLDAIIEPVKG